MKDMHIYFSGIGGVGLGPLAEIAHDAGYKVSGSDRSITLMTDELQKQGITVRFDQSGDAIEEINSREPVDWLVFSSAISSDHPELIKAKQLGIKTTKRDELLSHIIKEKKLQLIAVAGTHGKTTTTAMLVWTMQQLGIPVSYSIGTQISFGPSGLFNPESQYFIYECDEFDKNFLHFSPEFTLLTSYDYDHPDTYKTTSEYRDAFRQFISQSSWVTAQEKDLHEIYSESERPENVHGIAPPQEQLNLAGIHNRQNAALVIDLIKKLYVVEENNVIDAINRFPGTTRRFEKLADNLYSDYAHHPVEIAATLQLALEINPEVMVVYQPHQNIRQHAIKKLYSGCFKDARRVYWLPTYLSREDPLLEVISPSELSAEIEHPPVILSEMDEELWKQINQEREQGTLIVGMGAGDIDTWLRRQLQ
jgi:UDP-N-acetylmuramate--alanine ligase